MDFDYFYNRDGDRFNYVMLPKLLITGDVFKGLSSDAKILYACLLERIGLSFKNGWIDKENRVYIIFTIDEVMKVLNKSNKTAVKILNELDKSSGGIGLVERKRQGLGKPNILYVKDFMSAVNGECNSYTSEVKKLHARSVEPTLQEVKKVHGTNTNNIKPDNIKPNFIKAKPLGIYQNVLLTDEELTELKKELGLNLENYINRLSTYLKSTGKAYKDHKATMLTWYLKDDRNPKALTNGVWDISDYDRGDHL